MKPNNAVTVKLNPKLKGRNTRIYYRKGEYCQNIQNKDKLDKEKVSKWSKQNYTDEQFEEYMVKSFTNCKADQKW